MAAAAPRLWRGGRDQKYRLIKVRIARWAKIFRFTDDTLQKRAQEKVLHFLKFSSPQSLQTAE